MCWFYTRYNINADTELTTMINMINNAMNFALSIVISPIKDYNLPAIYSAISWVVLFPPRSGVTHLPSLITSTIISSIFLA